MSVPLLFSTKTPRALRDTHKRVEHRMINGKRKAKNIFDLSLKYGPMLPGKKLTRKSWNRFDNESYWLITRVSQGHVNTNLNVGKAWGVLKFQGKWIHNKEERKIHEAHRRGWEIVNDTYQYPYLEELVTPRVPSVLPSIENEEGEE
eukprot:TRINITY_DN4046_c0_g1_i3.p1 TRINITY_DN4046_c0_g1~~TRINITY_DN4046_c0_g1_i3.p1  ORF type:complete len:147 (+),score=27.39 TRINITY_DN4046_c0_g1_i3:55-495(+)